MHLLKCPDPFLEIRVSDTSCNPTLRALCAGYESEKWRSSQLADHLIEWLPQFCLKYSEVVGLGSHNAVKLLKQSARYVYDTQKFKYRGEVGELILHAIVTQEFNTLPFISKIYYKDSSNDTVKGFDCVHVIIRENNPELWLGEVKFYSDYKKAIKDVCDELIAHTKSDYLRKEFIAICNKSDINHPHYASILNLLNKNTTLDKIFTSIVIPVLVTYESQSLNNYTNICSEFEQSIKKETQSVYNYFIKNMPSIKPIIHLLTVPLQQKTSLVEAFDAELRKLQ